MNNPLISVLLPVYNCEKYILDAIKSILNQTFTDFELLIIDDASTDGTVAVVNSFKDKRIKIIQKPQNSGLSKSLNQGITIANGKYIARMDGDDISLPERLAKQFAFLEDNEDVAVCGTAFQIIGTDIIVSGPEDHEDIKAAMLMQCSIGHPTAMLRKSFLDEHALFYDTEKEPAEDFDLWARISGLGKLHNLQEVLFHYRNHEGQVSVTRRELQRQKAVEACFTMIGYLNYPFTKQEEIAYKKIFSQKEKPDLKEIYVYLKIKDHLLNLNNGYFKPDKFLAFLSFFEKKIVNQYFLGRKNFHPKIFIEYYQLKPHIVHRVATKDVFKLFIKSITYFKAK